MNKVLALALSASFFAFPGCTHYTLTPDRPQSLPRSADKPLPMTVGIALDASSDPTAQSIGPRFAEALTQANVFSHVVYPLSVSAEALQGVDLAITGRFGYAFRQDPAQVPKILLVCLTGFVTGALMSETSYHDATGGLSVRDASGAEVKTYAENISVEASSMVSMFAEQSTAEKGPPAAVDNIVAKLVQDIINDRSLYERLHRAAPQARALDVENAETPRGDAAQPWWKQ